MTARARFFSADKNFELNEQNATKVRTLNEGRFLKGIFKTLFDNAFVDPLKDVSLEKRAFVDDWFHRRGLAMARASFWLGFVLLIAGVFVVPPFVEDAKLRMFLYLGFGYGILNSPFWLYQINKKPKTAAISITIGGLIALYAIAFGIVYLGFSVEKLSNSYFATIVIASLSFYYCAFSPLRNYLVNLNALVIVVAELIAFSPIISPLYMVPAVLLNQFCALIVAWTSIFRERRFALAEFDRQQAAAAVVQDRLKQEIQLAEAIHESYAPEASLEFGGKWAVEVYRTVGERLSGDWVAFRMLSGDKIAVLVIDASGKGMQGALVVHAVQALWAASYSNPEFAPETWLGDLNTTLVRLGRKTLHTITVAIAIIDDKEITVWSAGHCPVFVIEESEDQHQIKALIGRGNIVGFSNVFAVQSLSYSFVLDSSRKIVLGTDGAIEPYIHKRRNNIGNFVDRIQNEGVKAFHDNISSDDRTLVIVSPMNQGAEVKGVA